jgi:hypothetical protein
MMTIHMLTDLTQRLARVERHVCILEKFLLAFLIATAIIGLLSLI